MVVRRGSDGQVLMAGDQVQIGGNETYESLCRRHWRIATGDAPAGEPSEPPPMTMAACDWCQWHAGVADLPPRSVDVWGWAPPPAGAPVLASRDAVLAQPWASAQSRAPPLLPA
jgi:hypothetical protein